jgi:thiol-disulfide isomerase/thioredoxin
MRCRSLPLAAFLLAVSCALPAAARRVPDPAFKTLAGEPRKLSQLRGSIVVVNFWATWCGPCQQELPRLGQLARAYAGKPVRFVFLSIDEPKDRAHIAPTLTRLHLDLESWVGADTDTLGAFGLGNIVPGTLVLDPYGQPVARVMGEARDADLRTALDWLLANRSGPPPAAMTRRY